MRSTLGRNLTIDVWTSSYEGVVDRGQRFRGAIWHHLGWHEAPLTPADLDATFGKPTATRTTCTGGMSIFSFNLLGTYTQGVPYNASAIKITWRRPA